MTRRTIYPLSVYLVWAVALPAILAATALLLVLSVDRDALVFDNPHLWWLGGAVPVGSLLFLYGLARRRRALGRFTSARLAPLLTERFSASRQAARSGLFIVAVLMIVAALIGPRWGVYLEKQKVYGRDIVVALDVSRSMLAADVAPNRLEQAKREIRQQLTERGAFAQSNRLALLAFAGSTSLRLPLTTDTLAFRSKLESLHVGAAPRGGTAIAQAIRAAVDLFAKSPKQATKVILLFTDGEDHEGGPIEEARVALKDQGIRIFTIGVGDPARTVGVEVPTSEDERKPLLHDGQIVFSRLDVTGLRSIAEAGGGDYAPLGQLYQVVNRIAGMRRAELSAEERMRHRPRYQWFVAMALLLLFAETLVNEVSATRPRQAQRVWQEEA